MHTEAPLRRSLRPAGAGASGALLALASLALIAALALAAALVLASPAGAEPPNPNEYECTGNVSAGEAEPGSSEQQVKYRFVCDGPITGYQLQSQLPLTGFAAAPLVTNLEKEPVSDSFSCGGDVPGFALNCVGSAKGPWEFVTGQFSVATKLCSKPLVDPLLTVTYAYFEKGVITQAISGPFDLGRPRHCPVSSYVGAGTRLEPLLQKASGGKGRHRKHHAHKARGRHGG
ncbi:MAG: hypothetical protein ACTHM1_10675 [Solirubrobacteraceae bacterium]